ncbi:MAG: hypothetical protein ACTTH5_07525 [Wolinella sp.]
MASEGKEGVGGIAWQERETSEANGRRGFEGAKGSDIGSSMRARGQAMARGIRAYRHAREGAIKAGGGIGD